MIAGQEKNTATRVELFTVNMRNDGILHIHTEGDRTVEMCHYLALMDAIGALTQGKKVPFLCTADAWTVPDEEVRQYMTRPDANPYCAASAYILPSLSQKILINLSIRTSGELRPMRTFSDQSEAIAWLRTFL